MNRNNQIVIDKVIEMFDTLIEAGEYLYGKSVENDYKMFESISNEMIKMVESIDNSIEHIKNDNENLKTDIKCKCIIYSINNILRYAKSRSSKLLNKIKYELIPMIEEAKFELYYWKVICIDKDKLKNYYENDIYVLTSNKYINEALSSGIYKYDLSIMVFAYNKVEYTKMCVENLLKYIPQDIKYELILINNGSSDGTKEYFESIAPSKQIDILINGGFGYATYRISEGKYLLTVSNDVIVTKNAIENMIKCIKSDKSIAWVVPSTPNVSNRQTIPANYTNIEEMHKFAEENNISDKYRWEQRSRLCNPIDLVRNEVTCSVNGIGVGGYINKHSMYSFPDDKLSALIRRNGYKMMLAKDSYCYHFGSVTLKDEIDNYNKETSNKDTFYEQGRIEFFNEFGIDPWGEGSCWDPMLFECLPCNEREHINILGINCGIGSNPLKIRENIKENSHNYDVDIYNSTDEKCYLNDLKGVSNFVEYMDSIEDIDNIFKFEKFKYIIFESNLDKYDNLLNVIEKLENKLDNGGIISIKVSDNDIKLQIKDKYKEAKESGQWVIYTSKINA